MKPDDIEESRRTLAKARIMLEYANKRGTLNDRGRFYGPMKDLLEDLIKNASSERVENFKQLMEAIVAYSKKR